VEVEHLFFFLPGPALFWSSSLLVCVLARVRSACFLWRGSQAAAARLQLPPGLKSGPLSFVFYRPQALELTSSCSQVVQILARVIGARCFWRGSRVVAARLQLPRGLASGPLSFWAVLTGHQLRTSPMQSLRTSPTSSPPSVRIPEPARLSFKCTGSGCTVITDTSDAALLHTNETGHSFDVLRLEPEPRVCRCGRVMHLQALYLCEGCDKPGPEKCECTSPAAPMPELPPEVRAEVLPEQPPQQLTLADELEMLQALLGQVLTQAERVGTAGALHLGPLFVSTDLEGLTERLRGSVELHSKRLAAKRLELDGSRAQLVDQLRDLAQKAQIVGDDSGALVLGGLAERLPQQLPGKVVAHV
jgi:hypothetical protein